MVKPIPGNDDMEHPRTESKALSAQSIDSELGIVIEHAGSTEHEKRAMGAAALRRIADTIEDDPDGGLLIARYIRIGSTEGAGEASDTALHQADEMLKQALARYEVMVGNVHDVVMDISETGVVSFINTAITELTGFSVDELTGKQLGEIIHPDDLEDVETVFQDGLTGEDQETKFRIIDSEENVKWVLASISALMADGGPCGLNVKLNDITELMELKEKFKEESERDSLTGLYNRRKVQEVLDMLEAEGRRMKRSPVSIFHIDVDDFKDTNTKYGHAGGDTALCEVASLLGLGMKDEHAREGEDYIIARTGGDEFMMILQRTDAQLAEEIRSRINVAFDNAYCPGSMNPQVSIGVGTALTSYEIKAALQAADDELGEIQKIKRDIRKVDILPET